MLPGSQLIRLWMEILTVSSCRPKLVVLAAPLPLSACNNSSSPTAPTGPDPRVLNQVPESETTVFHFSVGDSVDADRQDAYHRWIEGELGVGLAVHSIVSWHGHETAHVYSAVAGRPSDFFNEGLAVALSADPLAGDCA